jgi:hypothetical protein
LKEAYHNGDKDLSPVPQVGAAMTASLIQIPNDSFIVRAASEVFQKPFRGSWRAR